MPFSSVADDTHFLRLESAPRVIISAPNSSGDVHQTNKRLRSARLSTNVHGNVEPATIWYCGVWDTVLKSQRKQRNRFPCVPVSACRGLVASCLLHDARLSTEACINRMWRLRLTIHTCMHWDSALCRVYVEVGNLLTHSLMISHTIFFAPVNFSSSVRALSRWLHPRWIVCTYLVVNRCQSVATRWTACGRLTFIVSDSTRLDSCVTCRVCVCVLDIFCSREMVFMMKSTSLQFLIYPHYAILRIDAVDAHKSASFFIVFLEDLCVDGANAVMLDGVHSGMG